MKLFSKILIFSITALVCQTGMAGFKKSVSPNQITPEIAQAIESIKKHNDLQEKLAQGFIDLNFAIIDAALAEGANPFTIHQTEAIRSYVKGYRNELNFLLKADEVSPYLIALNIARNASIKVTTPYKNGFYKKLLNVVEALLQRNISVDREPTAHHGGLSYTFRQQMDLCLEEYESMPENPNYILTAEQKIMINDQVDFFKKLLELMQKYQPIEMEYASSFRFATQTEVKA